MTELIDPDGSLPPSLGSSFHYEETMTNFKSANQACLQLLAPCESHDTTDQNQELLKEDEILDRPILVGYAFGPKKMSTMGVVMAEASKTHLSTLATTVLVEEAEEDEAVSDQEDEEEEPRHDITIDLAGCTGPADDERRAQVEQNHEKAKQPIHNSPTEEEETTEAVYASSKETMKCSLPSNANTTTITNMHRISPRRKSMDTSKHPSNILLSLDSYNGGLQNIVRYLHSSCSSVDTNSTTTTLLTTGTTAVTPSSASTCGKLGSGGASTSEQSLDQQRRLRVSFVPLDPDLPLEGQHGAKMDIILHKLTEDILCLSKFSPQYPEIVPALGKTDGALENMLSNLQPHVPRDAQAAILRVHRLMQYQARYPDCSLADDPAKVLTLMSRSDIAHALATCLVGVTSTSGIPVASPKFVVWDGANVASQEAGTASNIIAERLQDADMTYPLIAKPLQAAGTKTSHYMTVLLDDTSLEHVEQTSCLLQEYANHNAVLYKVYVLGPNVHVYQRPSLPDLPALESLENKPSYVDFDSQRPYPRLSAFGAAATGEKTKLPSHVAVTADEVQPIVDALKQAFGLELFGFDILIASNSNADTNEKQMLVVDVNYFPSYKEVLNFPSLLAQYLTQRAVNSRRKQY